MSLQRGYLSAATADTIFAPASGQSRAAISVLRISGPRSFEVVNEVTRGPLPAARRLVRRAILCLDGQILDDAMVVIFPEGGSYTGQKMAEIHCHGGLAVSTAVIERLAEAGCRLAEPGEFTWRAFEAGRLGLEEVEGLGDLISAETELQRRQAMRSVAGDVSDRVGKWRNDILRAAALIEVTIDWGLGRSVAFRLRRKSGPSASFR